MSRYPLGADVIHLERPHREWRPRSCGISEGRGDSQRAPACSAAPPGTLLVRRTRCSAHAVAPIGELLDGTAAARPRTTTEGLRTRPHCARRVCSLIGWMDDCYFPYPHPAFSQRDAGLVVCHARHATHAHAELLRRCSCGSRPRPRACRRRPLLQLLQDLCARCCSTSTARFSTATRCTSKSSPRCSPSRGLRTNER